MFLTHITSRHTAPSCESVAAAGFVKPTSSVMGRTPLIKVLLCGVSSCPPSFIFASSYHPHCQHQPMVSGTSEVRQLLSYFLNLPRKTRTWNLPMSGCSFFMLINGSYTCRDISCKCCGFSYAFKGKHLYN